MLIVGSTEAWMAKTVTAVALLAASLIAVGCRGDDDSATPRTAPERVPPARAGEAPPKAEFVADANALCVEARQRAAPIYDAIGPKVAREDAAGVAAELRKALPIADELLKKMRALTPPAGDEAIIGRYVDLIARQRMRIRTLVEALYAEDISTIEVVVAELKEANGQARRLAHHYGLTRCDPPGLPAT